MIAAGLLLGSGLGEALARIAGVEFHPHLRNRVYFAEPDPLLGWRNRPGASGPYGGNEFRTRVTIDGHGQRGSRPHRPDRAAGSWRVALLGDSQAWGDGVGDDETFAALLEDRAGRAGLEVLNFACPGYGSDQELLVLGRDVPPWSPDVVVVAVYVGNDPADNLSRGTYQYPKPFFEVGPDGGLELRGVPVPTHRWLTAATEAYRALMRRSALLNAIAETTNGTAPDPAAKLPARPTVYSSIYEREPGDRARRGLPMTVRLIAEIVRRARDSGARPIVLLLPELWQVDIAIRPAWRADLRARGIDWQRPQRFLRRGLAGLRVEIVDALPALARASRRSPDGGPHTFRRQWRHLDPNGHRVVARVLGARLGLAAIAPPRPTTAAPATGGLNRR